MAVYIDPGHKLLAYDEELKNLLAGKLVYPINIEFDLSNVCPLQCSYCLYKHTHDNTIISLEHAKKVIDELASVGVKSIVYSGGGEPLTSPHFADIIEYAWNKNISQGLYTNGILLDRYLLPIIRYLEWVHFSVFAPTMQTYFKITGRNSFNKVVDNIRLLMKHKGRLVIGMGMIISQDNAEEIDTFFELGKEIGVDFIGFKPDCMITDKDTLLRWWKIVDKFPDGLVSKSQYRFIGQIDHRPYSLCLGHYLLTAVGADGNLYFCGSYRSNPEYSLGSLIDHSFKEIWDSDRHKELMKNLDTSKCPMPACRPDIHNRLLDKMIHPSVHVEFL